jgi:phosphoribosylglycinamide formyltransferase 1
MTNIAIFVSGQGSNCENIIKHFSKSKDIKISLVLSNRADAYALVRAKKYNVPTEVVSKDEIKNENTLMAIMKKYEINFIVLAGFLLMVPDFLINVYYHKIINIHPALLPKYGGKGMYGHHVHEAIKANNEKETGMTVHYVSNVCDGGDIIAQYRTSINPEDTSYDIAAKEMLLEQKFPIVIEKLIKEKKNNGSL